MTIRSKVIAVERITRTIFIVRGQRVILDRHLAAIYGVTTKRLNEQVKRNIQRFPGDFMFRLTVYENARSRSQFATLVRALMTPPIPKGRSIGFTADLESREE